MKCCCESPGTINSGIRGVLAGPAIVDGQRIIERCDACERFSGDAEAAIYFASRKGGLLKLDEKARVIWFPEKTRIVLR